MSADGLHNQRLVGTDFVQIRLGNVFVIFGPACSHVELALRVLLDKLLDDLAVFHIIGQADLHEVRLPDGAVAGEIAVAVGFKKAGIDVVLAVIQHSCVRTGELFASSTSPI